jgi:cation diffusion facilitator family transporter
MGSRGKTASNCTHCARVVVWIGIAEALVFIVLKVALGMAAGSRALVAASLYSMQDLISSVVAALGLKISAKPPDREHPYGHGKVEYVAVALMSLMMLLGIVALAITALASFFGEATEAEAPKMLALWVAAVCAVSCWLLAKFQGCAGRRLNSPSLKSCATHMHGDYLASIAVVVSVVGARLGYPALDHIVAVLEAFHVVYISGRMLGSAVTGLMDSTAEPQIVAKLKAVIAEPEAVQAVRQATARWSGQTLMAQTDVEVPGDMSMSEADKLRAEIRRAVKTQVCRHSETLVRLLPASGGASGQDGPRSMSVESVGADVVARAEPPGLAETVVGIHQLR